MSAREASWDSAPISFAPMTRQITAMIAPLFCDIQPSTSFNTLIQSAGRLVRGRWPLESRRTTVPTTARPPIHPARMARPSARHGGCPASGLRRRSESGSAGRRRRMTAPVRSPHPSGSRAYPPIPAWASARNCDRAPRNPGFFSVRRKHEKAPLSRGPFTAVKRLAGTQPAGCGETTLPSASCQAMPLSGPIGPVQITDIPSTPDSCNALIGSLRALPQR